MKTHHWNIPVPVPFNFRSTAYSHGWVDLAPNRWDNEGEVVHTVVELKDETVISLTLKAGGVDQAPTIKIAATLRDELNTQQKEEINSTVARMFRTDEDLSDFYRLCQQAGAPWNSLTPGTGRLLRSPTLFEDVIKTICTTNIQWSGTKSMVANLVQAVGKPQPGNSEVIAFPTIAAVARASNELLAQARLGYRAPYIATFARQAMNGEIALEECNNPDLSTEELQKRLLSIKGVGNYAANTLLMLLGRYEHLAYDTAMRDFVGQKYFDGQQPTEEDALAIYDSWGRWKYLAYWFDIYSGG